MAPMTFYEGIKVRSESSMLAGPSYVKILDEGLQ